MCGDYPLQSTQVLHLRLGGNDVAPQFEDPGEQRGVLSRPGGSLARKVNAPVCFVKRQNFFFHRRELLVGLLFLFLHESKGGI